MDPATAKMALQIAAALGRSRALRYLVVALIVTALLASLATLFGPWMLTTQLAASMRNAGDSDKDADSCPTQPGSPPFQSRLGFNAAQIGNAKIIWSVSDQEGAGRYGAIVGIATAIQESTLRNIPHGDRDSVGLFQQRMGWGSFEERMDPVTSSQLFFRALDKVKGWRDMSIAEAAQSVQKSAFPDAYAKHERAATGLVDVFESKADQGSWMARLMIESVMCGPPKAQSCRPSGLPVENGLTPDALRVLRCLKEQWPQLQSFGGIGDRPSNVDRDHQEGRAVDAMVPGYQSAGGQRLGDRIARWLVENHQGLGIKYVIWNERIWNVEREAEGWRNCGDNASCYNGPDDTAAHRDHVHVSVFGNAAGDDSKVNRGPIVTPVDDYELTAEFGQCSSHWTSCHTGLDFAAPTGSPIRTTMTGTVIYTGNGGPYGNLTKIKHASGVQTWYAHQSAIDVEAGENVTAGQIIGRLGSTGNTTGPHLHLEVRVNGSPVDPNQWLTSRGVAL